MCKNIWSNVKRCFAQIQLLFSTLSMLLFKVYLAVIWQFSEKQTERQREGMRNCIWTVGARSSPLKEKKSIKSWIAKISLSFSLQIRHYKEYESFWNCWLFWNLTHVNDKLPLGPLIFIGCHIREALKVQQIKLKRFYSEGLWVQKH